MGVQFLGPLRRSSGLFVLLQTILGESKIIQTGSRKLWIESHSPFEVVYCLSRSAGKCKDPAHNKIAIRVIGIEGDGALGFGDGLIVSALIQTSFANGVVDIRCGVFHGHLQVFFDPGASVGPSQFVIHILTNAGLICTGHSSVGRTVIGIQSNGLLEVADGLDQTLGSAFN